MHTFAAFFHHLLIHFPIVFLVVAATTSALAFVLRHDGLRTIARVALFLAVAGGLLAGTAGWLAMEEAIGRGMKAEDIATHRNTILIALGLAACALVVELANRAETRRRAAVSVALTGLAAAVIAA